MVQWFIHAQITRWVEDWFPGIVECRFTDRFEHEWVIVDKLPVVTAANLDANSNYPQPALIACKIVSHTRDDRGREIAEVETGPEMESQEGVTRFEVFADQLTTDHPGRKKAPG